MRFDLALAASEARSVSVVLLFQVNAQECTSGCIYFSLNLTESKR